MASQIPITVRAQPVNGSAAALRGKKRPGSPAASAAPPATASSCSSSNSGSKKKKGPLLTTTTAAHTQARLTHASHYLLKINQTLILFTPINLKRVKWPRPTFWEKRNRVEWNNGLRGDLKQMAPCLIVCCAEHSSGVCSGDWDESCGISWQQPAALHWAHSQTSAVQRSNIYGESLFPFVSSYFSYVFCCRRRRLSNQCQPYGFPLAVTALWDWWSSSR